MSDPTPAEVSTALVESLEPAPAEAVPPAPEVVPAPEAAPAPDPAPVEEPPKKRSRSKFSSTPVIFRSKDNDRTPYTVCGIYPYADMATGQLLWEVPQELIPRFQRHHHVTGGRIFIDPDQ